MASIPARRHGRLGAKKSNHGCITCKIRKVKCDERHPACDRCTRSGRKCDGYAAGVGYEPRQPNSQASSLSLDRPMEYPETNLAEVQSFEFFIGRIVPGFSRLVDEHFWYQLIPQLSRSDKVVWHAVNTFSCLIQYPQYSRVYALPSVEKSAVVDEHHRRALRWYSKSINHLQDRAKNGVLWSVSTVVTCILYICIECLQDNVSEAFILFQKAVGMLGLTVKDRDTASVEDVVRTLLRHMSASYGIPILQERVNQDHAEHGFQSLVDAGERLYALVTHAHGFISYIETIKDRQSKDWEAPSEMILQWRQVEANFYHWQTSFSITTGNLESSFRPEDQERYLVQVIVYNHYLIWLSACLSMYETSYDGLLPNFQIIIDHAQYLIGATQQNVQPLFLFETRIIPSLFFVALRCRHATVRRQAISLLRRGPKVENVWKAESIAGLAERILGIEESSSAHETSHLNSCDNPTPPEDRRVYKSAVVEVKGKDGSSTRCLKIGQWQQDKELNWFKCESIVRI